MDYRLGPCLWLRQKKSCARSMTFLVKKIELAFIDAWKGKDFIGLRWPEMLLRCNCPICNAMNLNVEESLLVKEARDWQPYLDFFLHKLLPSSRSYAMKIKKSSRFFVEEDPYIEEASITHLWDVWQWINLEHDIALESISATWSAEGICLTTMLDNLLSNKTQVKFNVFGPSLLCRISWL